MVPHHGGTGVGVVLSMQAVPGALAVLERLHLVHLEKGKEMQRFIKLCLQRGLAGPEPRAAPHCQPSMGSCARQGRNPTAPGPSPSTQGSECRLTCRPSAGLQPRRAHSHSCTVWKENGPPKCPQGEELWSPSASQATRQGAAGKGSTGHQPTALGLPSHQGQMPSQSLFQDLLEGDLLSACQGRLARPSTARTDRD